MTSTHGPATRGIRRSRGSRSGLAGGSARAAITLGFAGASSASSSSPPWSIGLTPHLGPDRLQHLVPRDLELRDALVLEDLYYVAVADSRAREGGGYPAGVVVGAE